MVQRFTVGGRLNPDGTAKSREQLNEEQRTGDARLEARVAVQAGPRVVGISFVRKTVEPEGLLRPQFSLASYEYAGDLEVPPSVTSVVVSGPYNPQAAGDTPSRRQIFVCRPTSSRMEAGCAKQILSRLGRRAFRRQLAADDIQSLTRLLRAGAEDRAASMPASSSVSRRFWSAPTSCSALRAIRPASNPAPSSECPTSSSPRGSPSSCGAASRTTSCSKSLSAAN